MVGGAARDRLLEVRARQLAHVGAEPLAHDLEDARPHRRRVEDAAVEEHRRRARVCVAPEELREVRGETRVGRVRQSHLLQPDATRALWSRVGVGTRQEAVDENLLRVAARQLDLERAADDASRSTQHGEGHALRRRVAEEALLRAAARVHEAAQLPVVERRAARGETLAQHVREREVHVVAAEEDVVADGDAAQRERAVLLGDGDETQVGRAAADVADENDVADPHLPSPCFARARDPRVAGGLRLLEEHDVLEPCFAGGAHRQLACRRVE